ncbi:hypothetical protein [Streptomyces sp. NPDC127033]|uniref:hypothetical protein n=1 Tax=Streptomyces sp. NPDC127033 TaxID=3347110 RepID=UPI0036477A39
MFPYVTDPRAVVTPDVHVPADSDPENALVTFLSSAQNLLLIVIAVLAVALLAGTQWADRRRSREGGGSAGTPANPPEPPRS